ncbi:hypothetical protein M8J77_008942 [Diaphorina citri]|nr:hypothetical protein M8J77_008942 [Diaphorina citri]
MVQQKFRRTVPDSNQQSQNSHDDRQHPERIGTRRRRKKRRRKRRRRRRRRISWLANLRTRFNKSSAELFRIATNKVRIAMMIANIPNG